MSAKTFIDSNILIYAFDESEEPKRLLANKLLNELWLTDSGALSVQVLQEFYTNVTRKIRTPIARPKAHKVIDHYAEWCGQTSVREVREALQIEADHRISFWDSLIVASAPSAARPASSPKT